MNNSITTEEINFKRYFRVFLLNQKRVTHLLHISQQYDSINITASTSNGKEDILRSAVVLNHASLDQFLRQIVRHRVANSGKELLKDIPLFKKIDSENDSKPKKLTKFYLSDLFECGNKPANQVILESIIEFYDRKSFNGITDITNELEKKLGLNISSLRDFFPNLGEMMARRHQIVHNADNDRSKGVHALKSISF